MNLNGQPQEPCVKLEILYFPQRTANNIVVNGPINDLATCFVMLGLGQRTLNKYWDRMESEQPQIIPVRGNLGG